MSPSGITVKPTVSITPSVDTRFSLSGNIGTIRYVGEVDGTNGVWLGVEWDDRNRGKHDGIKDGKRYFSCL
jgi:tubulin-specific chaperone E